MSELNHKIDKMTEEEEEADDGKKPWSYFVTRGIALLCLIIFVIFIAVYWD